MVISSVSLRDHRFLFRFASISPFATTRTKRRATNRRRRRRKGEVSLSLLSFYIYIYIYVSTNFAIVIATFIFIVLIIPRDPLTEFELIGYFIRRGRKGIPRREEERREIGERGTKGAKKKGRNCLAYHQLTPRFSARRKGCLPPLRLISPSFSPRQRGKGEGSSRFLELDRSIDRYAFRTYY